jgi:hypothetical protein
MSLKPLCMFFLACLLLAPVSVVASAQNQNRHPAMTYANAQTDPALQALVNEAAQTALVKFKDKNLQESNLAITLINFADPQHPTQASFRGDVGIYPASVVKLFYLVMAQHLLEEGKLKETEELKRAMKDMIVVSSNDATGYVIDEITGTTSGPELSGDEMKRWADKRNAVNRYFASLGYTGINTNQKTYCEGPYGREQFFRGANGENRNSLTTNAVARLLSEIVTGRAVTPSRSAAMMELLKRDYTTKSTDPDDQAHGFTALALSPGARLWSKAGWTSTTRHDAAYVELPNGAHFILVTFTTDHANDRDIIPTVARVVIDGLSKK